MGTNNIVNLVAKIQELEKENARLKAILDKHGITYKAEETISVVHNEDIRPATLPNSVCKKKLLYSKVFSKGVMMYLQDDGIAARHRSQATNLYVRGNGIVIFVTNADTSVRIAPTGSSLLCHTMTCIIILLARMLLDVM